MHTKCKSLLYKSEFISASVPIEDEKVFEFSIKRIFDSIHF